MNRVLSAARPFVPAGIQRSLRPFYREAIFRRAMKQFLSDPPAHAHPQSPVLRNLVRGWANEYWSALDDYLAACISHALTTRGNILECGSGLSTILIGAIATRRGLRHTALEHTPQWAAKVQRYLDRYQLDSVIVPPKPLRNYGEFSWYDVSPGMFHDPFSLVICDGPPASTVGGRYGLAPILKDRLAPGCLILLDDAGREQELAVARRWEVELGASSKTRGVHKPYLEMTVSAKTLAVA